jgi:methylated-DNA-protein-cysteine methyltransferase related protein
MKPVSKNLGPTFSERVVRLALSIPPGRVTTYGDIARACGAGPMAAQSITSILGKAYQDGERSIPFHRIVYSNGRIWNSPEHTVKRLKLYQKEGIEIDERGYIKHFHDIRLTF